MIHRKKQSSKHGLVINVGRNHEKLSRKYPCIKREALSVERKRENPSLELKK
ncbi:hypothetical protein ACQ27_gp429 [Klebsiella phage K64-1]|uniref:hypothetical protein n=1 Tax=Klebsiella phage K64-1 TaxID=1439894 RepID=UPI00248D149D|nr:hypothetical protein ACQ27_gp429 [Klebsiella phage K64-1]